MVSRLTFELKASCLKKIYRLTDGSQVSITLFEPIFWQWFVKRCISAHEI